jgi:hypothetical protein
MFKGPRVLVLWKTDDHYLATHAVDSALEIVATAIGRKLDHNVCWFSVNGKNDLAL